MDLRSFSTCDINFDGVLSMGSIDEIKKESDEIRTGTMNEINKLEKDIALIIAEYDDELAQSAHIDKSKFKGETSDVNLSDSVRMIKIRTY